MFVSQSSAGERGAGGNAIDRFRLMFFEEASELLVSLKDGLARLERQQQDRATCDATYRAIHSLKGAANMVGMSGIAEFAHCIESVVARVRAGSLLVDPRAATTLFAARDHLEAMVAAEAAGSPISASEELVESLRVLGNG
jgi:two-component system chemotaxis sensor kinase CheA